MFENPSQKKVVVVFSLLVLSGFGFFLSSWYANKLTAQPFSMQVDVKLEVSGKPLKISRIVQCVAKTDWVGFEKFSTYYVNPQTQLFGHELKDGKVLLVWIPEACQFARKQDGKLHWPIVDPENYPLIGWLESAQDLDKIFIYTSPFAYKRKTSFISFKGMEIKSPSLDRTPDKPDNYSWLGSIEHPILYEENVAAKKGPKDFPFYKRLSFNQSINWKNSNESPLKAYDLSRIKLRKTGTNFPSVNELLENTINKNEIDLEALKAKVSDNRDQNIILLEHNRRSEAFAKYEFYDLFKNRMLVNSPFTPYDDTVMHFLKTGQLPWLHTIPVEVRGNGNFLRYDLEGLLILYKDEYLKNIKYKENPFYFGDSEHDPALNYMKSNIIFYSKEKNKFYAFGDTNMHHLARISE